MKRIFSAALAAALVLSSAAVMPANAEKYGDGNELVVFGDSIAAGYGLGTSDYNYGQICADYINGSVDNYAHSGDTTQDLLEKLDSLTAEQQNAVRQADSVIISIGGNDIMRYAANLLFDFAVKNDLLKDEANITSTADASFTDIINALDRSKLSELRQNTTKLFALSNVFYNIEEGLTGTDKKTGDIENTIIPNIETAVSRIKSINPDARIIVQTIYNPVQLQSEYLSEHSQMSEVVSLVKGHFTAVLGSFNNQVKQIEGVEIADIYTAFTSGNGNAWYFTNMQDDENLDFHPNKKGHHAIASVILDIIAEPADDGGTLRQVYSGLSDKNDYPAAALASYQKFAGTYSTGDIDGNGMLDSSDASAILTEYSALSTDSPSVLSEDARKATDANSDGKVEASDASAVLSYYAHLSTGGTGSLKNYIQENYQ